MTGQEALQSTIVPDFFMHAGDQTRVLVLPWQALFSAAPPPAPHFESWQTPYEMNAYLDTVGGKRRPRCKQLSQGYVFTEELRAGLGYEWLSLKPIRTTRHSFPLGFSFRASSQHKAVHGCQQDHQLGDAVQAKEG